jgi:acetyl-CoA decarbonylase/synthase complex subunit beta
MKTGMFADIPVDVGVIYEGERIRKPDMYVELGGTKVDRKFELLRVKSPDEVEDGKITVIGPEIRDLKEGSSVPFGIYIEVAGKELEEEMEGVMERRIHDFCNYIEGFMHLNQRYDIWLRLSKNSVKKGLTFQLIGKVLERLYKSELPIIEKIQITFITDPAEVQKMHPEALKVYEARDARARGLKDEDVEVFYGCTLCQSFAPTHVCVITPQRYANCGAISWFDGRAASRVDPKGPIFEIKKGKLLDEFAGEYEGVNQIVKEKSLGEISRVQLYTAFGYPHTSCGCFEGVAFYIPEVDGIGIVHRDFKGAAINGLPFSAMADSTAGGRQVDGFHGISIEYLRSPKFLQVDGGWNRVVWIPAEVKERVKDFIPKELVEKIPTEKEVKKIDELKSFLEAHGHPIVERWKAIEAAPPPVPAEAAAPAPAVSLPVSAVGGFNVVLKNVKIHAERVIVRRRKEGGGKSGGEKEK